MKINILYVVWLELFGKKMVRRILLSRIYPKLVCSSPLGATLLKVRVACKFCPRLQAHTHIHTKTQLLRS